MLTFNCYLQWLPYLRVFIWFRIQWKRLQIWYFWSVNQEAPGSISEHALTNVLLHCTLLCLSVSSDNSLQSFLFFRPLEFHSAIALGAGWLKWRSFLYFKDFINNYILWNCWISHHWELWCFLFSSEVILHKVAVTFSFAASNKYYMSDIWALHLTVIGILPIGVYGSIGPEVLLDENPTVLASKKKKACSPWSENDHIILAGSNFSSSADLAKAPLEWQCKILSTE